ncbi:heparinase II/III family protein [Rhodosalinus halophilus]|nr:heparinase II/III family protein [Rhodosalinus halophilus]
MGQTSRQPTRRRAVRYARLANRYHAWRASLGRPATGFVSQPEPRTIGNPSRGRQLIAGNLMFAGHLVEAPEADLWDIEVPDAAFIDETHGFGWLDDLAATGDTAARRLAQRWLDGWIARYGRGRGPGWSPEQAARRMTRWLHHALFLLHGQSPEGQAAYFRALATHARFLARRWRKTPPGLPRFEALCGLVQAGLALDGLQRLLAPAVGGLERACRTQIDADGGLATRNPEELMEVLSLLTWTDAALRAAHREAGPEHRGAIARIAPTLRSLRHADGALARFHGGGGGAEGRLDAALAASGSRRWRDDGLAMGYARLSAGRTTAIIDAAPPPRGDASIGAHASTLAFELTSGRRPVIVNCGSGASFGPGWRRAGRATPSHSTVTLEGLSSARLETSAPDGRSDRAPLRVAPARVPAVTTRSPEGWMFEAGHDGYVAEFGLTHARVLELSADGRTLRGQDLLLALEDADKRRFDRALDAGKLRGIAWQARFHLHPDTDAELDLGGTAVSIALRSGEVWVFRGDAAARLSLEPSVYLERGRLRPRATQQIVLSGRALEYASRVRWSLAKTEDTALAVRDLAFGAADALE